MPRPNSQRMLVLVLLALWMAPGASALALSLHLVLDHHGGRPAGHGAQQEDKLVLATLHGHHHAEVATEHEHSGALVKGPTVRRDPGAFALAPGVASVAPAFAYSGSTGRRLLRGPPHPLFHTHCSLLL